ncbi:MAG: preprotein translocase subunit YajC [Oscillospiraceae bacterium]|jgi:preprotein translocase subunit YajC|nr:preprotein translocase subunit YajC [Oscillospiraceae bacterium]
MSQNPVLMVVLMVGMIAVMYFVTIRPQKKRQKDEQAMRDNLQIGDEITTIGGIMGRVVTVKEDSLILETGADRTKLRIIRTAVGVNNTAQEKLEAERDAAKAEQQQAQEEKLADAGKKRKKSRKGDPEDRDA